MNKLVVIIVLLFFSNGTLFSFWSQAKQETKVKKKSCKLEGMAGEQPEEVCQVKEFIKRIARLAKEGRKLYKGTSALLFCGKPGTGKTMATRKMLAEIAAYQKTLEKKSEGAKTLSAKIKTPGGQLLDMISGGEKSSDVGEAKKGDNKESDILQEDLLAHTSNTFFYDTKDLVHSQGRNLSGELKRIYEIAEDVARREKRPVIIVFDDASTDGNNRETLTLLNSVLDSQFDNPLVTTIITSNSDLSSFDPSLKSRCTIVHWEMPDEAKLIALITFYNRINDAPLRDIDIKMLVAKYKNLSCRDIAEIFHNVVTNAADNEGSISISNIQQVFDMQNREVNPQEYVEKPSFWRSVWRIFFSGV